MSFKKPYAAHGIIERIPAKPVHVGRSVQRGACKPSAAGQLRGDFFCDEGCVRLKGLRKWIFVGDLQKSCACGHKRFAPLERHEFAVERQFRIRVKRHAQRVFRHRA